MEPSFIERVQSEIKRARSKHTHNIVSPHEAYGVIFEEVWEFFLEIITQKPDKNRMLIELVHIATMCLRAAEDLELVTKEE